MGKKTKMYPYECSKCMGAEYRCGLSKKNCECMGYGSKYCSEEGMVLVLESKNIKTIKISGRYDGYGRIYISDKYKNRPNPSNIKITWSKFNLIPYTRDNYSTKNNCHYKQLCIDIDGNLSKGVDIY